MQTRRINLTPNPDDQLIHLNPEDTDALAALIGRHFRLHFFEKNKLYTTKSDTCQLSHHLIKSRDPAHRGAVFYVIHPKLSIGVGQSSRFRPAIGQITHQPDNSLTFSIPPIRKGVRIKNRQSAQEGRLQSGKPYLFTNADRDYNLARLLPYLGAEKPIHVYKENKPHLGSFFKSYSVMNWLKGGDFDHTVTALIKNKTLCSTQQLIDCVILPTLETYADRIASTQHAHRDICPWNVFFHYDLNTATTTVNYLDADTLSAYGKPDSPVGSLGYIASEIQFADPNTPMPVLPTRDIFALGHMLMGAINPDIAVVAFIETWYGEDIINLQRDLLTQMHCYDPDQLLQQGTPPIKIRLRYAEDERYVLFHSIQEEINAAVLAARHAVTELLKSMTRLYPTKRPTIEALIAQFRAISVQLAAGQCAVLPRAFLTPAPASTSMPSSAASSSANLYASSSPLFSRPAATSRVTTAPAPRTPRAQPKCIGCQIL